MNRFFKFSIFFLTVSIIVPTVYAQIPQKFNYQAVVRDNGTPVFESQVDLRFSIHDGQASGNIVYQELQQTVTDQYGHINVSVGAGTAVIGSFEEIDWEVGEKFLQVEVNYNNLGFMDMGVSQLLSVPYAIYSGSSGGAVQGPKGDTGEPGPQGPQGEPGTSGADGSSILSGTGIPLSSLGKTGDFYIDLNEYKMYGPKETEWPGSGVSLKGEDGKDGNMPDGTEPGEMLYWDGSEWVRVPSGQEGDVLLFIDGKPIWDEFGKKQHNDFVYKEVYSLATGRTWLDRNLGARQAATDYADTLSYGDLYQWGRYSDGHEKRDSEVTYNLSSSGIPGHGDFIVLDIFNERNFDWLDPQNHNLWQPMSEINDPCPKGFRIPTQVEWEAERQSWFTDDATGALGSPLRLPLAGYRIFTGSLIDEGVNGYYWSSTVDNIYAVYIGLNFDDNFKAGGMRANGYSVRCIKN